MQWIRFACPDAEQLDPYYVAHGHAVDYAVETHREPPQAVTEGGYPAVEAYHAGKLCTEWTDAGTELLVLAYDDPDTVGIIKAYEQRARTDKLRKRVTKFRPTSAAALPRGAGFQALLGKNNKHVRNNLASGTFKRVLLDNNSGPLIVTYGARIPFALNGITPAAPARRKGPSQRKQGGGLRPRYPVGESLWRRRRSVWVPQVRAQTGVRRDSALQRLRASDV